MPTAPQAAAAAGLLLALHPYGVIGGVTEDSYNMKVSDTLPGNLLPQFKFMLTDVEGGGLAVPFGGGARKCPGDIFSMLETTVILAMILREFDFDLQCDPATIKACPDDTRMAKMSAKSAKSDEVCSKHWISKRCERVQIL